MHLLFSIKFNWLKLDYSISNTIENFLIDLKCISKVMKFLTFEYMSFIQF